MSTYYDGCLITNKKWIANNLDMNIVKNFGFDNVNEVYDDDLIKEAVAYSSSTHQEYIGQILKEKIDDFPKLMTFLTNAKKMHNSCTKSETPILLSASNDKEDIEQIYAMLDKDFDCKEYMKLSEDEKKAYNEARYNVYVEVPYYYRGGKLINIDCLKDAQKQYTESFEKAKAKKAKWEEMKLSMDYLKLSGEEKENINESFEFVDEDIEYGDYATNAINKMIYTLEFFNSACCDETAYLYIYNTDCGKAEYPEWLEKLMDENA